MAPRSTRAKPAQAPAEDHATEAATANEPKLPPPDTNPPHIFLLPKQASPQTRFVSLYHEASQSTERYLYCPLSGMYELKKMAAASQGRYRSLLLTGQHSSDTHIKTPAYVLESANVLTATPLDPLFLLMSLFKSFGTNSQESRVMARTEEDHWETLGQTSPHMAVLLRRSEFCNLLRPRLAALCEVVGMGDDEAYRPSLPRLAAELKRKAENMIKEGTWPASLEEAHVRKPLEAPAGAATRASFVRQEDSNLSENAVGEDTKVAASDETESKQQELIASKEVRHLARLRTAINLVLHSYVPTTLHTPIWKCLKDVDFAPLDDHLKAVAALKAEVQALRSLSDNISRKRGGGGGFEDDEAAEERAEKKRRVQEQEAKRKQESRATKQLAKVDTSGMKKMSSFFTAKAKAK